MVDKAKLGFWELFTYFLIGLLIAISVLTYVVLLNEVEWKTIAKILKEANAVLLLLIPLLALILGMLFEPISNYSLKFFEGLKILKQRESRSVSSLMPIIQKYLPADLGEKQRFRYCKAVVEQNYPNSNISVFLARFGFYRSVGILSLIHFPLTLMLIDIDCLSLLYSISFAFLSFIFIKRAQFFKGHLEYEVFFNYLAYNENVVFKGKNQQISS